MMLLILAKFSCLNMHQLMTGGLIFTCIKGLCTPTLTKMTQHVGATSIEFNAKRASSSALFKQGSEFEQSMSLIEFNGPLGQIKIV